MNSHDDSTSEPHIIQTNPAIGDPGNLHIYGADPASPRPFVLAVHGGGWHAGDQTSYTRLGPKFKALGVAWAQPSYRLAPKFRFPCAYDDLVHLLAWLRDHGTSQGLDASRCLLYGSSAGGHLVMLLAARATKENRPMPCIRGVVSYCGIMDLSAQHAFDATRKSTMTENFLGGPPEADEAAYRDASPLCHVHAHMPPAWMAHGTADGTVPVEQSRQMVQALKAAGHDPVYLEARGLGHTQVEFGYDGNALASPNLLFEADMLRFVYRSLCT